MLLEASAPNRRAIEEAKHTLRARLPVRRRDPVLDSALIAQLGPVLRASTGSVAFVWPLSDEPDLRPLMQELAHAGRALLLPCIEAPGRALYFRPWQPGTVLVRGPLGTSAPQGGPSLTPDIVLVPTLAFDRERNRLGRGRGYYDRTLAAHPAAEAIGFAYADAEIPVVPVGPHDRRLDRMVTERGSF